MSRLGVFWNKVMEMMMIKPKTQGFIQSKLQRRLLKIMPDQKLNNCKEERTGTLYFNQFNQ